MQIVGIIEALQHSMGMANESKKFMAVQFLVIVVVFPLLLQVFAMVIVFVVGVSIVIVVMFPLSLLLQVFAMVIVFIVGVSIVIVVVSKIWAWLFNVRPTIQIVIGLLA